MTASPASFLPLPSHTGHPSDPNSSPRHKQLVKQTQRLVAQTFYGTLLKQMRDSPFKSDVFDGGRGGQAFAGMLDQHLADHMARGTGNKLVKSIVKQIEHPHAKALRPNAAAQSLPAARPISAAMAAKLASPVMVHPTGK